MKSARTKNLTKELAAIRQRLDEAEETLRAIRDGEVDALMGAGKKGKQVFTLAGAEHAYRILIEAMNEGALTLTTEKTILYANQCFARMVNCPLERVTGGSFCRFLSAADGDTLRTHLKKAAQTGIKIQLLLHACDGSKLPVQISIRPLAKDGGKNKIISMVVTDLTESRRTEEMLRALTQRVVQVQEAERGQVALELHDNITQLLCAILVRSQTLADQLATHDSPAQQEALKLRDLLGHTAEEVECITRNLRPGVLELLGLDAVLRATSSEFTARTGVVVTLTGVALAARLPPDTELALYRILQEALKNVHKHARAQQVSVHLARLGNTVQLLIKDDGVGFNTERQPARRKGTSRLGLLGMHERAAYVGGTLTVKSVRRTGTEIEVRILLSPGNPAVN
jgi:two-component system NarL family sensor kinase